MNTQTTWRVGLADWSEDGNARYELLGIKRVSATDARLIAAAPDLLAALIDLADHDWTYTGAEADITNPDSLYNRVARARLVIKKAQS